MLYGPDGSKLAVMNGQVVAKAMITLPGGAAAVYRQPRPRLRNGGSRADTGITNAITSIYGHPETTPHTPWGN